MPHNRVTTFGLLKGRFDQCGQSLNAPERAECQTLHLLLALHEALGLLTLDVRPNLLVGIDPQRAREQVDQPKPAAEALCIVAHEFGFVDGVSVHDHIHGRLLADHQTLEEFAKDLGGDAALMKHESKLAAWSDCRNIVQRKAPVGDSNHRHLALRRPACSGVIVRANARLVGKVDRGTCGLRLHANSRIGFALPLVHHHRVFLLSLVQQLLHREAQPPHDATDRGQQFLSEFTVAQFGEQRERPQAEFELELQGRVVAQRLCQRTHLSRSKLGRFPGNGLCHQRILTTVGEVRELAKQGFHVDPIGAGKLRRGLSIARRRDGLLSHDWQTLVIYRAAMGIAFVLHPYILNSFNFIFCRAIIYFTMHLAIQEIASNIADRSSATCSDECMAQRRIVA